MLATPVSKIYYIYHCIELLLADAHSHRGTSIWSNLDNDIKQCISLQSFKQAIKGQLLKQVFSYVFFFYEFLFSYIYYL